MKTTKLEPGTELHFTLLGVPFGWNFLTGKDRQDMLAFAKAVWDAARATPPAVMPAAPSDAEFESWLHMVCLQKPSPEAYDLARDAYQHAAAIYRSMQPQTEPAAGEQARPTKITPETPVECTTCGGLVVGVAGEQAGAVAQTISDLMRVIDAYAFDYKEQGKLGPTRREVARALDEALAAPGAAIAAREQFKEVQPDGTVTDVDPEDIAALPYLSERLQDHTCTRVENAGNTPGLTLYKTKIGAHPEHQLYATEAFALWTNLGKALAPILASRNEAPAAPRAEQRKPLNDTQIAALRARVPDGDFMGEEEQAAFTRGIEAAERYHGIIP